MVDHNYDNTHTLIMVKVMQGEVTPISHCSHNSLVPRLFIQCVYRFQYNVWY